MKAALFAGQGAHRRGMGAGLFGRFPREVALIDDVLGYSVAELCLEDPQGRLGRTECAQPALFTVAALQVLAGPEETRVAWTAGHSLGEIAALFAAGSFDLRTGVELVAERGRLMAGVEGGMLAVLGAEAEELRTWLREEDLAALDIANFNTARQQVLAGPRAGLDRASSVLAARPGVRCLLLPVSAPFHSRYMRVVSSRFGEYLQGLGARLRDPERPVLANVDAEPYRPGDLVKTLTAQVHRPVRWHETLRALRERGVDEIVEVGPGSTLTRMWEAVGQEPAPTRSVTPVVPPTVPPVREVSAGALGSSSFRTDYDTRLACVGGAMAWGIASTRMVVRLVRHGLFGFFGTGGLDLPTIKDSLAELHRELGRGAFGMNLLAQPDDPALERATVDLYLNEGVRAVEAAGFLGVTTNLVRYRFTGAHRDASGVPVARNRIMAKVSRPEVVDQFALPPAPRIVAELVASGGLSAEEGRVAAELPVAQDICVESDSGGHTDGGVALVLLPSLRRRCERIAREHAYPVPVRVGAAGGLGAPEALAAVFLMGAEFVVLGSVLQCSPEAGTSDQVKDLLAELDVQDTAYAPAGDMFEYGARVQVVRRATLFAARGNKLAQLYNQHEAWGDIDAGLRTRIESTFFHRGFDEIWETVEARRRARAAAPVAGDERTRLRLVLRWYFGHTVRLALTGDPDRANYQIQCGPAMGAFNQFARDTSLQPWPERHVERVVDGLMAGAAGVLAGRTA